MRSMARQLQSGGDRRRSGTPIGLALWRRKEQDLLAESAGVREGAGCVLVVDDDEVNRLVAEGCLVSEGVDVRLADSGPTALDEVAAGGIDLILLDIMMPGMDGFETLGALRQIDAAADLPIVFLTALKDLDTHGRAISSSADDFLTKPINPTVLVMRVRSLLRLRNAQRALKEAERTLRAQHDELAVHARWHHHLRRLVVHDLRSPLGTLMLASDYVSGAAGLSESERETVEDMLDSVGRMRRLVADFSDVDGSLQTGLRATHDPTDITAMLQEVGRAAVASAEVSRVRLEMDIPSDLLMFDVDASLLRRAVHALVEHAAQNILPGSVVRLRAIAGDSGVRIEVEDHGPAIPVEDHARLFQPWSVEPGGRPSGRRRPGLGLPLVRLVAEAHGGSAYIRSVEAGATTVGLELPDVRPAGGITPS